MRIKVVFRFAILSCVVNTASCMQNELHHLTGWMAYPSSHVYSLARYAQGYIAGSMDKENEITQIIKLMTSNEQQVSPLQQELAKRINLSDYGKELYVRGQIYEETIRMKTHKSSFSIGSFCAGALCATLGLGAYYLFTKGSSSSLIFDSAKV